MAVLEGYGTWLVLCWGDELKRPCAHMHFTLRVHVRLHGTHELHARGYLHLLRLHDVQPSRARRWCLIATHITHRICTHVYRHSRTRTPPLRALTPFPRSTQFTPHVHVHRTWYPCMMLIERTRRPSPAPTYTFSCRKYIVA